MSSSESRKGRSYIPWLVGGALTFAVLLVVGLLALSLFTHDEKSVVDKCKSSPDLEASTPDAEGLIELQGNRARPTLTIALADRTAKLEDIFFSTKDRKTVEGAITAQLIEVPRRGADRAERIVGDVRVHASPRIGRTMVFLEACVDREGRWRAGSYQGTVRIYGPQLNDFDYAIVITQKWPWEVAVLLLLVAGIAFFAVAFFTESLSFEGRKGDQGRSVLGRTLFGALVAIAAMAPTFWGTYWNNPTWGSEPDAHIAGIVAAGFTAAIAGLALAKRLLATDEQSKKEDKDNADTTPPTITARNPAPAATGVALGVSPTATFSEAMNPATLTSTTFTLTKQGAGSPVAATVSYAGATATLDPSGNLDASSTYTALVRGGASGAKDVAGNPLAADVSWSFTTAAGADTTPPAPEAPREPDAPSR